MTNLSKIVSPTAYMLFYTKTSAQNFFRQTLSIPDFWPHVVAAAVQVVGTGKDKKSKLKRKKVRAQIKNLQTSMASFAT